MSNLNLNKNPKELFQEILSIIEEKQKGLIPSLTALLEEFLNYIILKERQNFLQQHQNDKANGFYKTIGLLCLLILFMLKCELQITLSKNRPFYFYRYKSLRL